MGLFRTVSALRAATSNIKLSNTTIRGGTIQPLESRRLLSLTVPAYNSDPGASHTIYLNFVGTPAFAWNRDDGHGDYAIHGPGGAGTAVPAYNIDSDANNFSTAELNEIQSIWARVSEKYSPFDVNVTTVNPGTFADNKALECIIGGSDSDWYNQGAGGTSAIGGFTSSLPNICFIFSADVTGDTPDNRVHFVGDSAAHECGHEMGLQHERANGTATTYYNGSATVSPIMGGSSINYTPRGIWWKTNAITTDQKSSDPVQDELSILHSVLGTRPDDQIKTGTPQLSLYSDGSFSSGSGIIETSSDFDTFSFVPTTSRVTFTVSDFAGGGMLAPQMTIVRASDSYTPAQSVSAKNTSCSDTATGLVPGTAYVVSVYSDGSYSSLGQYSLTGSQQQFATYDSGNRFVNIGGFDGNNNLTISVVPSSGITNNDPGQLYITDSVNGGPLQTQQFSMSGLNLVEITLGSGNDIITINPTQALNGQSFHPGVKIDAGGGSNTLNISKGSATSGDFNVNSNVQISFATTDVTFKNISAIFLQGNSSATTFNVFTWADLCPLTLQGGSGAETFDLAADIANSGGSDVSVDGGGGSDNLLLDASTLQVSKSFDIVSGELITPARNGQRTVDYANVESITINATPQNDGLSVPSLESGTNVFFHGGSGNDQVTVGDSADNYNAEQVLGNVYFYGDGGTDSAFLDDASATTAHTYVVDHTHIGTTVGGNLFNSGNVESLTIDGSDANNTYAIYEGQTGVPLVLNGGAGNDTFNFSNATYWNATVYGNGGFNTLTVDDRSGSSAPYRTDIRDQSVTHFYGTASSNTSYQIGYNNIGSASYYGAPTTNLINILSTSANIASGYQWSVVSGSGNDAINVYPHNTATGAPTLLGAIGILGGGGTDTVTFDDSATPVAVDYHFVNLYGASTANIISLGGPGVGVASDMENIVVLGTSLNDEFDIDTFKSGSSLTLNGNGGNDTCDVALGSKELSGSFAAMPSFVFNGGAATDVLNIHSDNSTGAWTFYQTPTSVVAAKTGFSVNVTNSGVEAFSIVSGSGNDSFSIQNPTGTTTTTNAGGGLNSMYVSPGGNILFNASQNFSSLSLDTGASAATVASGNLVLRTNNLTVYGTSRLDLANNTMILDYTGTSPASTLRGYLTAGRNGGAWNGSTGIVSSSVAGLSGGAIGYGEASAILGANGGTFAGQSVDATALLIRTTYLGDANLDRTVNAADFVLLSNNFGRTGAAWNQGDFNYDATTDAADFVLLSNNFGKTLTVPPVAAADLGLASVVTLPTKKVATVSSLVLASGAAAPLLN